MPFNIEHPTPCKSRTSDKGTDGAVEVGLIAWSTITLNFVCFLQVGKNNFRPPPKVDSSVIRIEPRVPPPPINFQEWDALTRIAFGRKNKTLLANFKTTTVISSLAKNYAAANLTSISSSSPATTSLISKTGTINSTQPKDFQQLEKFVTEKIERVLQTIEFKDKRARHLDVDDFIKLLVEFNKEHIHFA